LLVILGAVVVMAVAGAASAGGRVETEDAGADEAGRIPVLAGEERRG
jgi:MFS transporter, CP family, cyanate transporter